MLAEQKISAEVIDLRTIFPPDLDTIIESIAHTGKLLVVDEDFTFCGLAGEILAEVVEQGSHLLKAPPGRVTCEPVPSPFSPPLEAAAMITAAKIIDGAKAVLAGRPLIPTRISENIGFSVSMQNPHLVQSSTAAQHDLRITSDGRLVEIILPHQDLTVSEGMIAKWLKPIGANVNKNEPILEYETDKATMELEAPAQGVLEKIIVQQGATVPFGTVLGHIRCT